MNFTVIWRQSTLEQLADFYLEATPEDRDRMADGVEALNRRLENDPLSEGESRDGAIRVVFSPLLSLSILVDTQSAIVYVFGIRRFGR